MPATQLLPAADRGLLLAEFRAELARRRRAGGLSQGRLATRMGFDRTTVNKVERGAIEPSREFARQAEVVLEAHGSSGGAGRRSTRPGARRGRRRACRSTSRLPVRAPPRPPARASRPNGAAGCWSARGSTSTAWS